MARRVADVRLGLAIVAGHAPARPASRVPGAARRAARRRRAASPLLADPPGGDTHPGDRRRGPARRRRARRRGLRRRRGRRRRSYEQALDVWGRFLFSRHPRAGGDPARRSWARTRIRFLDLIGALYAAAGRGRAGRHAGRAPRDRPRLVGVPARAPADPQPDLDAAAVPARLGRRERGERARDDAADAARSCRRTCSASPPPRCRPARPPGCRAACRSWASASRSSRAWRRPRRSSPRSGWPRPSRSRVAAAWVEARPPWTRELPGRVPRPRAHRVPERRAPTGRSRRRRPSRARRRSPRELAEGRLWPHFERRRDAAATSCAPAMRGCSAATSTTSR